MRVFLDTADARLAGELFGWGAFAGVTTNPLLLARAGIPVDKAIRELAAAMPGEIFAQAVGQNADEIFREGMRLAGLLAERLTIKVPATSGGLCAIRMLSAEGIPCAATAVFKASQALLCARAGAVYAIPFWHRIGETGGDAEAEVTQAAQLLERLAASGVRARVLAASLRSPEQACAALRAGAQAITVSPDVAQALLDDSRTRAAAAEFARAASSADPE